MVLVHQFKAQTAVPRLDIKIMATKNTSRVRKKNVVAEREDRAREILKALDLWSWAKEVRMANVLLQAYYPRFIVKLAEETEQTRDTDQILKALYGAINQDTIDCGILGAEFPTRDYLCFVLPIARRIQAIPPRGSRIAEFARYARAQTEHFASKDFMTDAFYSVNVKLDAELARFCKIDSCIYYLTFRREDRRCNASGMDSFAFLLNKGAPRVRHVTKDRKTRPAYWCGHPFGSKGVEWVEWPRSLVGLPEEGPPLPVLVQNHTLDQLDARTALPPEDEWRARTWLWRSLRKPKLSGMPNQPGRFLVEYRLSGHHIGYLVAHPVDHVVLIESFLFLTMNGTPEGNLLWDRLRLRRDDKTFLGLDRFDTFLLSDIQHDPELVSILDECGCGHLFHITRDLPVEYADAGYAREMRKYLRLDDNCNRKRS